MTDIKDLKPCPFCGSLDLEDCCIYVKCNQCLAEGPKMNEGRFDDHADWTDHENAIKAWNKRSKGKKDASTDRG